MNHKSSTAESSRPLVRLRRTAWIRQRTKARHVEGHARRAIALHVTHSCRCTGNNPTNSRTHAPPQTGKDSRLATRANRFLQVKSVSHLSTDAIGDSWVGQQSCARRSTSRRITEFSLIWSMPTGFSLPQLALWCVLRMWVGDSPDETHNYEMQSGIREGRSMGWCCSRFSCARTFGWRSARW